MESKETDFRTEPEELRSLRRTVIKKSPQAPFYSSVSLDSLPSFVSTFDSLYSLTSKF
jgi:hypothetical protein